MIHIYIENNASTGNPPYAGPGASRYNSSSVTRQAAPLGDRPPHSIHIYLRPLSGKEAAMNYSIPLCEDGLTLFLGGGVVGRVCRNAITK